MRVSTGHESSSTSWAVSARFRSASTDTRKRSTRASRARRASNSDRVIISVSLRRRAEMVAERWESPVTRAVSPKTPPSPNRFTAMGWPRVEELRATKMPLATTCRESPESPSWNTTSLRAKRRRTATCRSLRRSSSPRCAIRSGVTTAAGAGADPASSWPDAALRARRRVARGRSRDRDAPVQREPQLGVDAGPVDVAPHPHAALFQGADGVAPHVQGPACGGDAVEDAVAVVHALVAPLDPDALGTGRAGAPRAGGPAGAPRA